MGGHLVIPQNGISYANELPMSSHVPALKGNFSCVARVAARSSFYCISSNVIMNKNYTVMRFCGL